MKLKAPIIVPLVVLVLVVVFSILALGSPQRAADSTLMTQISDFELRAQSDLEKMVISRVVQTEPMKLQLATLSSQVPNLSDDEQAIAYDILGQVSQAISIVEAKYGQAAHANS